MVSVIILIIVFAVIAFLGGLKYKELLSKVANLEARVKEDQGLDEAPTILDVSPKAVNARRHDADYNDEDSAVIKVKTRAEIEKDKDRKLNDYVAHYKE